MPVVRVRQIKRWDQSAVAADKSIGDGTVHDAARPVKLLQRDVRARLVQIFDPLVVNGISPMRPKQARDSQRHQGIAQRRGVQNTRIINDRPARQSPNTPCLAPAPALAARRGQHKILCPDAHGMLLIHSSEPACVFLPSGMEFFRCQEGEKDKAARH